MSETTAKPQGGLGETIRIVVQALLIALVIRSLLFQPFNIPSGSMKATLLVGDYIFVSKYAYGYSSVSFPLPFKLFSGRVFASEPKRGDVIVFRNPVNKSDDYIKRLIGMPGDRIQMKRGVLFINDQAVPKVAVEDFVDRFPDGGTRVVKRFRETLPNGVSYDVLDIDPNGPADNTEIYTVPAGHYFMMGDNRDDSRDSRFPHDVGYVPFDDLIGRAEIIWQSVEEPYSLLQFWRWPWSMRVKRIFTSLRV